MLWWSELAQAHCLLQVEAGRVPEWLSKLVSGLYQSLDSTWTFSLKTLSFPSGICRPLWA